MLVIFTNINTQSVSLKYPDKYGLIVLILKEVLIFIVKIKLKLKIKPIKGLQVKWILLLTVIYATNILIIQVLDNAYPVFQTVWHVVLVQHWYLSGFIFTIFTTNINVILLVVLC